MRIKFLMPCNGTEYGEIVFIDDCTELKIRVQHDCLLEPVGSGWESKTPKEIYLLLTCASYFYNQFLFHPERAEKYKK